MRPTKHRKSSSLLKLIKMNFTKPYSRILLIVQIKYLKHPINFMRGESWAMREYQPFSEYIMYLVGSLAAVPVD